VDTFNGCLYADGTSILVAFGDNLCGQCDVPPVKPSNNSSSSGSGSGSASNSNGNNSNSNGDGSDGEDAEFPTDMSYPTAVVHWTGLDKVQISMIACGSLHTAAIACNRVFTWGNGLGGRLGHSDGHSKSQPFEVLFENDQFELDRRMIHIACG